MDLSTALAWLVAIVALGVGGAIVTSLISAWVNRQIKDAVVTAVTASSAMLTSASANMQGVTTGAIESMQDSFTTYVNALLLVHGSSELPRSMKSVKSSDNADSQQPAQQK